MDIENAIIIGGGPAGLTAGIYAGRAGLKPLLFEGFMAGGLPPGGQLTLTAEIENFPGFPEGMTGLGLVQNMKKQATKFGVRFLTKTIDRVDFSVSPFKLFAGEEEFLSKSVILAMGARAKRLNTPGVNKFRERGVSACATCDGALPVFRDKRLVVVGGGDAACTEAIFLSRWASEVVMLVRKDYLKATKIMQDKILENPNIRILRNTEITECLGNERLEELKMINNITGENSVMECGGLFFAIGHQPNTDFVQKFLTIDEDGFLITNGGKTNIDGIFAAGDVQDKVYKQAITSAGSGAMVAMQAEKFLEGLA